MASAPMSLSSNAMLKNAFVEACRPDRLSSELIQLYNRVSTIALTIFDQSHSDPFQKKDFELSFAKPISWVAKKGNVAPVAFATILAMRVALREYEQENPGNSNIDELAREVSIVASQVLSGTFQGNPREQINRLFNLFGAYQREYSGLEDIQLPDNLKNLECEIKIDERSGHLIADIGKSYAQQLLVACRNAITEGYLTPEGAEHLKLPDNIGHVVLAYEGEIESVNTDILESIKRKKVELSLGRLYAVPVAGDNRYAAIFAALINAQDAQGINAIRAEMGLDPLPDNRPPRYTFGVVRNQHLQIGKSELADLIREACPEITPFVDHIPQKEIFIQE